MEPVTLTQHNFVYKGNDKSDVGDLSCFVTDDDTLSHWKPDEKELEMLIDGGYVMVGITGHPIPPISVSVSEKSEEVADDGS